MNAKLTLVLVVASLAFALAMGCRPGFDRKRDQGFKALRPGMLKDEVFARMGAAPVWTNSEFTLGQYQGNEKEYAKTNGTGAKVFYTWHNGIDWSYCVGFDAQSQLVVKGEGGT